MKIWNVGKGNDNTKDRKTWEGMKEEDNLITTSMKESRSRCNEKLEKKKGVLHLRLPV